MFTLHLDLHMSFVPPMRDNGPGLVLTREIALPFAPSAGLQLYSKYMDDCPTPGGFTLDDVTWDVDRECFLARTRLVHQDFPMLLIPDMVKDWLRKGWTLGSFLDRYEEATEELATENVVDYDEAGNAQHQAPNQRPPSWNRVFKAIIRHMAESFDNDALAYAFDTTGRFFTEAEVRQRYEEPAVRDFRDAKASFERMSWEDREKWRFRVSKHPSIEELVVSTDEAGGHSSTADDQNPPS